MTVPLEIVCLFLGSMLALQGWTLGQVVGLKTKLAAMEQSLRDCQKRKTC